MTTVKDVLKTDPYRDRKGSPIYIDKDTFYAESDGVYVKPSRGLCESCCQSIEQGNSSIKLFHINGYAGCGKTLFAHYMMHRYGYDDDYYYAFDQGEGKNYSLHYIRKRMIQQLSDRIAKISRSFPKVFKEFYETSKNIYGESDEYKMLSELINEDDSWAKETDLGTLDVISNTQYAVTIKESMEKIADESKYNINDIIKFLLFSDYLWRCSEVIGEVHGKQNNKYVFCLLDNLDNLSRNAVVDLYVDVRDVISKLTDQRMMFGHFVENQFADINCIVLFPTREVTQRRLREGLRKQNQDYLLQSGNGVFTFDLEENCPSSDKIIASRKKYCIKKHLTSDVINKVDIIETLMKIPYVTAQFSQLLNGNYSHCVDRIMEIWEEMPEWVKECVELQGDKRYGMEFAKCSQEGTRGILLRMLLELFKDRNVYDSVTDLDAPDLFNVNGKLGLNELECEAEPGTYSVSVSRLLLTFIRGSKDNKVRINHIFRCFSHLDGKEICRYLFALSENIRDTWRRLIVFSSNIPSSVNDLYKQYEYYKSNPSANSEVFSEVELCLSGKTYIHTVVPNFEFFLSRLNMENGIDINPPLFSEKSIRNREERICIKSIEKVLSSIEACANEIYRYDVDMVQKCINDNSKIEYIGKLFVAGNSKQESTKQSHLSRIIFSHISYIERFRRYLMFIMCEGDEKNLSNEAMLLNEQIISYIIRYLTLFDITPLEHEYQSLLDNRYLSDEYRKCVDTKKTCKEIFSVIDSQQILKRHNKIRKEITIGYYNQKAAQERLLDEIQKIHNSNYTIISKIELD